MENKTERFEETELRGGWSSGTVVSPVGLILNASVCHAFMTVCPVALLHSEAVYKANGWSRL